MKLAYLVLPLLATAACTDDQFATQASKVEGIYRVDSHLRNEAACSPGGSPVQDDQTFAYAKQLDILGMPALQITSCISLDDCRTKASEASWEGAISFAFTMTGADGDTLTGFEQTSGWTSENGVCTMPELSHSKLVLTGDSAQIEKRIQIGADYQSNDGWCTTDKGKASAEKASCSELETLTMTKIEGL